MKICYLAKTSICNVKDKLGKRYFQLMLQTNNKKKNQHFNVKKNKGYR